MAVDFCDYFWGEEHNGWNVLYQNMKHGHNASKEIAEFFKERWSIDESYCKSLTKLANKAGGSNEKGTLAPVFSLLRVSLEMMSSVHCHMVNKIQDLVKEVAKYNEELHKKQKVVKDEESQTEEIVKVIQATSGLAQKARETYSQRCQDLEKVKRDGASPKDVEKAEAKLRKAHDEYKSLVEKYNVNRDDFEKKLTQSCKRFQCVEESHISQMLQFVQTYINVLQNDHKAMGQIHSDFLNKYSQYTIDKLLGTFTLSKYTGLEKPVVMVFEDTSSLGSAISGQQSPEPATADQSKSSADDASSTGVGGGSDKISSGGVLTGGRVGDKMNIVGSPVLSSMGSLSGLSGVAKLTTSKKESKATRGKHIFSLSKVSRPGKDIACVEGNVCAANGENAEPACNKNACSPNQTIVPMSRPIRPVTYRKPERTKRGRRTTSLLNIFVASTNASGNQDRSNSSSSNANEDRAITPLTEETSSHSWSGVSGSLPSSPTKVTSAPSSPVGASDESSLSRTFFRSSKWFLRSRREKKKEKKGKKKKEGDSPSNKEDKSDNENSEEAKTVDLISVGGTTNVKDDIEVSVHSDKIPTETKDDLDSVVEKSFEESRGQNTCTASDKLEEPDLKVDEEGYSIRPQLNKSNPHEISFDSSSDSDSEIGIDKKIHVEIKPISNGSTVPSASIDEIKATLEGMSFSPYATTKKIQEPADNQPMKRSSSITQNIGSSSSDLLGLNLNFSNNFPIKTDEKDQDIGGGSNGIVSNASVGFPDSSRNPTHNPIPVAPQLSRYAEVSEILGDGRNSDSGAAATLPPRGSTSSRGSTPTPAIAVPRPSSRKMLENTNSRGAQSPATNSVLSRTESISSLEFRTAGMATGISRGPSPLTIGMSDTIPLAVAFQELCHAYFRGTDESRVQMKVTGEMMVSFPAGIVGVLAANPTPAQLSFKVHNFNNLTDPLPNKQLVTYDDAQSSENCGSYNFNMSALSSLLRKQAEQNPTASYFNVDIIKYQVSNAAGVEYAPLQLVSYWRCEDTHTDLRVDYGYNSSAMAQPAPLLNISLSVPVDGIVRNMQSKPHGQWLKDQQKALWKITELSANSADVGKGSLRGKFEVAAGPSTPTTVSAQFNCEGTTLSGLEFSLLGSGYRVSLVKKRFVSGKYICDADAVLRLRYGALPS